MRPFRHRDPGIVGAALARDDVVVQIILDGVHLAAETARVVWHAAAGRVALVDRRGRGRGRERRRRTASAASRSQVRDGVVRGPDGVLAGQRR